MLLVGTLGPGHPAWAGDPGGNKTGVAADAQNASGEPFVVPEPDAKDPEYAKKKQAYDEFKAMADKEPLAAKLADFVGQNRVAINLVWTLVAGFLVMFMQAGFALVETGLCRAKNASHTMLMNFLIYVIGKSGWLS
jgi:Amt family ammonium transporter